MFITAGMGGGTGSGAAPGFFMVLQQIKIGTLVSLNSKHEQTMHLRDMFSCRGTHIQLYSKYEV